MTTEAQHYAVYLTAAQGDQAAGSVVDSIMWDGVALLTLPAGRAAAADPTNQYPIGSTYTAPASGS